MKKGITEQKVQRMRNLATGRYKDKTQLRSGYSSKRVDYKEGDVWEENGKKWTIKRGIKRTVGKLNKARKLREVPLCCPKCEGSMSHQAHKAMFRRWGMCLICVTKWEHKMKKDGVYDEWHKQFDEANFNAYIDDIQQEFEQWLQTRESKQYITEAGKIEDWKGGKSKKELRETFKKELNKALESRYEQK